MIIPVSLASAFVVVVVLLFVVFGFAIIVLSETSLDFVEKT